MAERQCMLPGEIVKKSNELARARLSTESVAINRILANLISTIRTDDEEFHPFEIPVSSIIDYGYEAGKPFKTVRDACRQMVQMFAETREVDAQGKETFTVIPLFSRLTYREKRGSLEVRFNQEAKPYLLGLKREFTRYNILEYLVLPSAYSQKLFEILKSWQGKPEVIIDLRELHRALNVPATLKANFKDFRINVLQKAHKDITEKTTMRWYWEPIKAGRSVEKIRFVFGEKPQELPQSEIAAFRQKAKEDKAARLRTQRFLRAAKCAEAKGGDCRAQDNKRIICKICRECHILSSIPDAPDCPYDAIAALYHEILPECLGIKIMDETRKKRMTELWNNRIQAGKYSDTEGGLDYWRQFFGYIRGCPWIMDKTPRTDFSWILDNFSKIIEGRYEERKEY